MQTLAEHQRLPGSDGLHSNQQCDERGAQDKKEEKEIKKKQELPTTYGVMPVVSRESRMSPLTVPRRQGKTVYMAGSKDQEGENDEDKNNTTDKQSDPGQEAAHKKRSKGGIHQTP